MRPPSRRHGDDDDDGDNQHDSDTGIANGRSRRSSVRAQVHYVESGEEYDVSRQNRRVRVRVNGPRRPDVIKSEDDDDEDQRVGEADAVSPKRGSRRDPKRNQGQGGTLQSPPSDHSSPRRSARIRSTEPRDRSHLTGSLAISAAKATSKGRFSPPGPRRSSRSALSRTSRQAETRALTVARIANRKGSLVSLVQHGSPTFTSQPVTFHVLRSLPFITDCNANLHLSFPPRLGSERS